jgi:hypothetical protein
MKTKTKLGSFQNQEPNNIGSNLRTSCSRVFFCDEFSSHKKKWLESFDATHSKDIFLEKNGSKVTILGESSPWLSSFCSVAALLTAIVALGKV